jgi:hypothetical protein
MYGLQQAGNLANELLQRNLAKGGYRPAPHTHGLWTHDTRIISFSLVVDDFGVKYVGRKHTECLHQKNYNISSDWKVGAYCVLTLDWDYEKRTGDLSLPGYIKAALYKYQHDALERPEQAPHTWNPPIYGAKTQFVDDKTNSPPSPTILPINILASEQSNAKEVTADKVIELLNYCNTHPEKKYDTMHLT